MSLLNAGLLGSLSGKVGNVVVVNRRGTTYLRSLPNYKKSSWTDKQAQGRKRFALVNQFCQQYKAGVIVPIWNLNPGKTSGYHQFLAANIKAFDSEGDIQDRSLLHFSTGFLPPLYQVKASKDLGEITVSWVNDQDISKVRLNDELWYMAVVGENITGPFQSGLARGTFGGVFNLHDSATSELYLFFAAADRKSYSPDRYIAF